MATKAELEDQIKQLKSEIRELRKNSQGHKLEDMTERTWGVVKMAQNEEETKFRYKVVRVSFSDELGVGIVEAEDRVNKDFPDVQTPLGYARQLTNEHNVKRAQGRK